MTIKNLGKSLSKVGPEIRAGHNFAAHFNIVKPSLTQEEISYNLIKENLDQLFLIKLNNDDIMLRGEFELIGDNLLFAGSPWFYSAEEVLKKNLHFQDFALSDPLLDSLQLLNNQVMVTNELKESLQLIKSQKDKLKKDQEELIRLSLVASANENAVIFCKPNAEIFWCNDSFTGMTGFSKEEAYGKTFVDLGILNMDRKLAKNIVQKNPFKEEFQHFRKDGSWFLGFLKSTPVTDGEGNISYYFLRIEDVSYQKQYQENLEKEREKLHQIVSNMNLGLVEVNGNNEIVFTNKCFTEISEYSEEELLTKKTHELVVFETDKSLLVEGTERRKRGILDSYEVSLKTKNGTIKNILISPAPLYDADNNWKGSVGVVLDLTEQRKQEQQLHLLSSNY